MDQDMLSYYAKRASEYERIYLKEERQADLQKLTAILQDTFNKKEVLEIACGTGYWTERIAKSALSIKATDINDAVLDIAKAKHYAPAQVSFEKADIFQPSATAQYQSLFGGFIWSHIKLEDLSQFIDTINLQLKEGGIIVLIDNKYVAGSSLPITGKDSAGNTYQQRKLDDGSTYSIVKNFPSKSFIQELLNGKAKDVVFTDLDYYWMLKYKKP